MISLSYEVYRHGLGKRCSNLVSCKNDLITLLQISTLVFAILTLLKVGPFGQIPAAYANPSAYAALALCIALFAYDACVSLKQRNYIAGQAAQRKADDVNSKTIDFDPRVFGFWDIIDKNNKNKKYHVWPFWEANKFTRTDLKDNELFFWCTQGSGSRVIIPTNKNVIASHKNGILALRDALDQLHSGEKKYRKRPSSWL